MTKNPAQDVAVIVGGGPGISSSCARLFAKEGMRVAVAARQPDKPVLQTLEKDHGVRRYACDAADPASVETLFRNVVSDLGTPTLVVPTSTAAFPASSARPSRRPSRAWRSTRSETRRSVLSWWVSRPPG
jgi:NAD(P)-dependent dehydrogenase (short-subunit alcohol dehydrogenase family)